MDQGEPPAGADDTRCVVGRPDGGTRSDGQSERRRRHAHLIPRRGADEDAKDAHSASHRLQYGRR